ncbi:hypothetical protein AB0B09_34840, partial [Streptomyces sp. NPDC044948]
MHVPHLPRVRPTRALFSALCAAALGAGLLAGGGPASASVAAPAEAPAASAAAGSKVVGYFTEWGVYDRDYHVKNIESSGSAGELTHINYSFGNVTGGKCAMGDAYAATDSRPGADTEDLHDLVAIQVRPDRVQLLLLL